MQIEIQYLQYRSSNGLNRLDTIPRGEIYLISRRKASIKIYVDHRRSKLGIDSSISLSITLMGDGWLSRVNGRVSRVTYNQRDPADWFVRVDVNYHRV